MKTCTETKQRFHIRVTPFGPALDSLGLLVHEDKTRDNSRDQEQQRDVDICSMQIINLAKIQNELVLVSAAVRLQNELVLVSAAVPSSESTMFKSNNDVCTFELGR